MSELPAVARSITLDCTFCEAERFFKVIAHLSDNAAKAKCEVCGRSKTLRAGDKPGDKLGVTLDPNKASKKLRNTTGLLAAAEKRKLASAERKAEMSARKDADGRAEYNKQYESLKTQIGVEKAVNYGMKINYSVANAIQHPTFGLGFVTVATPDRIEVAFETGVRQLIHNRL